MWGRYITNANESTIPQTFKASNEAVAMHNSEISSLQQEVQRLEADLKERRKVYHDKVENAVIKMNLAKEEVQRLRAEIKIQQEAMAEQLKYRKEDADKIFELDGLVDMLNHEKEILEAENKKLEEENERLERNNLMLMV